MRNVRNATLQQKLTKNYNGNVSQKIKYDKLCVLRQTNILFTWVLKIVMVILHYVENIPFF